MIEGERFSMFTDYCYNNHIRISVAERLYGYHEEFKKYDFNALFE